LRARVTDSISVICVKELHHFITQKMKYRRELNFVTNVFVTPVNEVAILE